MGPICKLVLPVSGLGSQFMPLSRSVPIEMFPLVDRPIIEFAIDEAVASGISEIIFVTHRDKRVIEDHFDGMPEFTSRPIAGEHDTAAAFTGNLKSTKVRFCAIRQDTLPGLGNALLCARPIIGDAPFAVILPEHLIDATTPALGQMLAQFALTAGNLIGVAPLTTPKTLSTGAMSNEPAKVRLSASQGRLHTVVGKEDVDADDVKVMRAVGRYVLTPGIFDCLDAINLISGNAKSNTPKAIDPNVLDGVDRTDVADRTASGQGELVAALALLLQSEPVFGLQLTGEHFNCGSKAGLLEASLTFGLRHPDTANALRQTILSLSASLLDTKLIASAGAALPRERHARRAATQDAH